MKKKKINITIDGPAGSGKGTTASAVARSLKYIYLDSGAIYRAITLYFIKLNIKHTEKEKILFELKNIKIELTGDEKVLLNGEDVTREIRTEEVTRAISGTYPTNQDIRDFVKNISDKIIRQKGVVIDGRDAGSVLAPDAELKIYLDADINIRAKRRIKDFAVKDTYTKLQEVKSDLKKRDNADSKWLEIAEKNGIRVDTSKMTIEGQIIKILSLVKDLL